MKKYKAVVCDLDGTLLNSNHKISDYTTRVIRRIIQKGIKVIIATGRHYKDAIHYKDILECESYLIALNGAVILNENNEIIKTCTIPCKYGDKIIDFPRDEDIFMNISQGENWYSSKLREQDRKFINESGFNQEVVDSFDKAKGKEISKVFYMCDDLNKIQVLENKLQESFGKNLNITSSFPQCIEVMAGDANKGNAIKEILKDINCSEDEVVAFGDGLNDYEMLSVAGKGFIMENANPKLKEMLPECEVIGNNNEDAIGIYLAKLFL
ncbi:Cof-type HAD-IIB family hydrolase [Fusobacterium sp. MFO224]|uniref:Cof-type HAD-IIB family hydrolase n=1 Tax=Fusobacterium sp. MFO224 TaxID=3378070 RepID=UPI00385306B6